ncbi:2Fe-2S iron-sulfur cluster-binding protein, partial [Sinorhizobium meliloti]
MISLTVNGSPHQIDADPATPLLYVLRDELALNGAKYGCGLGQCGSCT